MARPNAQTRIQGYFLDKNTPTTAETLATQLNLSIERIQAALDSLVKDKVITADGVKVVKYSLTNPEKTAKAMGDSKAGRGIAA